MNPSAALLETISVNESAPPGPDAGDWAEHFTFPELGEQFEKLDL